MSQDEKFFYQWFGSDGVCFQDIDTFAASIPKDDDTIDMRIFCNGGSVVEGWAIYDRLRQSGKKITCTIEGKAASMATIIMLAAPKESRKAYENASLLLHNPWVPGWALGEQLNAKDLENQAEEMRMWQNKMVDAYVERCGCDRDEIQALMDKDIFINTDKAKELGLISDTLPAVSASGSKHLDKFINSHKKNPKSMKEEKIEVKASLLDKVLAKLGLKSLDEIEASVSNDVVGMELSTSDGQTLTVEREEGDPQVGDKASPDGTFEMPDGKTITVKDGVITDITTSDDNNNDPEPGTSSEGNNGNEPTQAKVIEDLKAQVSALTTERNNLKAQLDTAKKMAKSTEDLRILNAVKMAGGAEKVLGAVSSHYSPAQRSSASKKASNSDENIKDTLVARYKARHNKK